MCLCREGAELAASGGGDVPLLFSLGILAAFLGTSRPWVHNALAAIGAPEEVQLFVKSLCALASARFLTQGGRVDLSQRSSVAQACPGSGRLFEVAFDAPLALGVGWGGGLGQSVRARRHGRFLEPACSSGGRAALQTIDGATGWARRRRRREGGCAGGAAPRPAGAVAFSMRASWGAWRRIARGTISSARRLA